MNRITGVVRMYARDKWGWFFLPWIIMGSSFVINLIIAGTLSDEPLRTGGLASIFIYMMVAGIVGASQSFPFAIGFTVRRKDFLLGTLAMMGGVSLISSVIILLLRAIESGTDGWGVDLRFFDISYLNEGNVVAQWWVLFSFMLHMFALGFVISSIHRRFGRAGIITAMILVMLAVTIGLFLIGYFDRWEDIGNWLKDNPPTAAEFSSWLAPVTTVYALATYAMLRKATV